MALSFDFCTNAMYIFPLDSIVNKGTLESFIKATEFNSSSKKTGNKTK